MADQKRDTRARKRVRGRTSMAVRREDMLAIIAGAFIELGYAGATTAQLARRCKVPENVLYRAWPSKQAMFIAVIDYIHDRTIEQWSRVLARGGARPAERLLAYEAVHHGENRLYRIIFAGLMESHDRQIHAALQSMYRRIQTYIEQLVTGHRAGRETSLALAPADVAWALIGLGLVQEVGRELHLLTSAEQTRIIRNTGRLLLDERSPARRRKRGT